MILGDAVKRVKDRSHRGDSTITSDEITAKILRAFSDAKRELIRRIPKRKLFKQDTLSVLQGTTIYSLASDLQEPIAFSYVLNNSLRRLQKVDSDREWLDNFFRPNTDQNDPTVYREIGADGSGNRQIELFPTPKQSLTIDYEYYKTTNTEFTTSDLSTEIADLPEEIHDALWKGALYHFLKGFDDQGQIIAKQDYVEAISAYDNDDEEDLDTDLAFRFGIENVFDRTTRFRID